MLHEILSSPILLHKGYQVVLFVVHLVVTGFETCNKYEIKNSLGQRVYFAREGAGCCVNSCIDASVECLRL